MYSGTPVFLRKKGGGIFFQVCAMSLRGRWFNLATIFEEVDPVDPSFFCMSPMSPMFLVCLQSLNVLATRMLEPRRKFSEASEPDAQGYPMLQIYSRLWGFWRTAFWFGLEVFITVTVVCQMNWTKNLWYIHESCFILLRCLRITPKQLNPCGFWSLENSGRCKGEPFCIESREEHLELSSSSWHCDLLI